MPKHSFKPGQLVEAAGNPDDPGWNDSWWAAQVIKPPRSEKEQKGTVWVRYVELLEDDEKTHVTEALPAARVRPLAPDDSVGPLATWRAGDAVDCWHDDGWWEGYVRCTFDDRLEVFFPGTNECYDDVLPPEQRGPGDHRVRSGFDWNATTGKWVKRDSKRFPGAGDFRSGASPRAQGQQQKQQEQQEQRDQEEQQPQPQEPAQLLKPGHAEPARAERRERQREQQKGARDRQRAANAAAEKAPARPSPSPSQQEGAAAGWQADQAIDGLLYQLAPTDSDEGQQFVPSPPALQQKQEQGQVAAGAGAAAGQAPPEPAPAAKQVHETDGGAAEAQLQAAEAQPEAPPHQQQLLALDEAVGRAGVPPQQQQQQQQQADAGGQRARKAVGEPPPAQKRPASAKQQAPARGELASAKQQQQPDKQRPAKQLSAKAAQPAAAPANAAVQQPQHQQRPASRAPVQPKQLPLAKQPSLPKQAAAAKQATAPKQPAAAIRAAAPKQGAALKQTKRPRELAAEDEERGKRAKPAAAKPKIPKLTALKPEAAKPVAAKPAAAPGVFVIPKRKLIDTPVKRRKQHNEGAPAAGKHRRGARASPVAGARGRAAVPGLRVCMDNLPPSMRSEDLGALLEQLGVEHVQCAEVATVELDSGPLSLGYGVVTFEPEVQPDLDRLRSACILTPACPVPRPLLVHPPRLASGYPWGSRPDMPGHLQLPHPVNAHFVQPNSIEFEMALEWRQLLRQCQEAKERLLQLHVQELADVLSTCEQDPSSGSMLDGLGHSTADRWQQEQQQQQVASRCVWLKDVPPAVTTREQLTLIFEQFGYPQRVDILRDPVTGKPNGHVVVWMQSAEAAAGVAANLQEMVFVPAATPRPLAAEVATPAAAGSRRVYDAALRRVFGGDDGARCQAEGKGLEVVVLRDEVYGQPTVPAVHRAAVLARRCLASQHAESAALEARRLERSVALAAEQEKRYRIEVGKLDALNQLIEAPVVVALRSEYGMPQPKLFRKSAALPAAHA